jgi:sulfur-oxidizing protein SoxA
LNRSFAFVAAAFVVSSAIAADAPARKSGFDYMSPATQAMQKDDSQNPAMLWVQDGEALWNRAVGGAGKSCAGCHGDAKAAMKGVAARYPAFDGSQSKPVTLSGRINLCRTRNQKAEPLKPESEALLGIEAYVALQSRGMPVIANDDPRVKPYVDRGEKLFRERVGQLDLSCAQCHDERAGEKLAGSVIPQAHATGYPIYRLEWQAMGSLQRRLRNCLTGVRSDPYPFGAIEFTELELYLNRRAAGMPVETPAVRP